MLALTSNLCRYGEGTPIAHAALSLVSVSGGAADLTAAADDAGVFAAPKVAPGSWQLLIEKEHYETLTVAVGLYKLYALDP